MTEQQEHKTVRMSEITPEILENINVGDWIEGIGDIGCYYDRKIIRIVGTWLRRFTPPNKDGVHWITGAELREIYADDLSLDKYDEIRKRPASQNSGLYEPVGQKPDPCLVCQIRLKGSHQCDGNPCGSKVEYARKEHDRAIEQAAREDEQRKWRDELAEAAAEARKDEREKVLKEIMDYVRKSKYFGKHFMLIMCESLRSGVKKP